LGSVAAVAHHLVARLSQVGEQRVAGGAPLVAEDEVEGTVAEERLALPDEGLVVEGQPRVLVGGEPGVAGPRVDEGARRVEPRRVGEARMRVTGTEVTVSGTDRLDRVSVRVADAETRLRLDRFDR
jgi:hypothetical protein